MTRWTQTWLLNRLIVDDDMDIADAQQQRQYDEDTNVITNNAGDGDMIDDEPINPVGDAAYEVTTSATRTPDSRRARAARLKIRRTPPGA